MAQRAAVEKGEADAEAERGWGGVGRTRGARRRPARGAGARRLAAAGALVALLAAGCGHAARVPLEARGAAAQASGEVVVVERRYGVRVVQLRVDGFDGLVARDGTPSYVVWAQERAGAGLENIGTLQVTDGRGFLEAVTSYRHFQLIVTAEPSAVVARPSERRLFVADVAH